MLFDKATRDEVFVDEVDLVERAERAERTDDCEGDELRPLTADLIGVSGESSL